MLSGCRERSMATDTFFRSFFVFFFVQDRLIMLARGRMLLDALSAFMKAEEKQAAK
jgi:hypothetical protein